MYTLWHVDKNKIAFKLPYFSIDNACVIYTKNV